MTDDVFKPTGIWHIVGEKDAGKTWAAIGAYPLDRTVYFLDDVKRPPVPIDGFHKFVDLNEEYGHLKLLEFAKKLRADVQALDPTNVDAIVFDTWGRASLAIRFWAKLNPFEFREKEAYSKMGVIKGSEEWNEANRYEGHVISQLASQVKALFLITHTKNEYVAGAKTGNLIPDAGKMITQVCNARVWFEPTNVGPPVILVPKRISKFKMVDGVAQPVNVVPRVIRPRGEKTVWQMFDRYWQEPIDGREPEPDEIPTPEEIAKLDGILSDSMMMMWQAELAEKKRREAEAEEYKKERYGEFRARVVQLREDEHQGAPIPVSARNIYKALENEYPEFNVSDTVGVLERM